MDAALGNGCGGTLRKSDGWCVQRREEHEQSSEGGNVRPAARESAAGVTSIGIRAYEDAVLAARDRATEDCSTRRALHCQVGFLRAHAGLHGPPASLAGGLTLY